MWPFRKVIKPDAQLGGLPACMSIRTNDNVFRPILKQRTKVTFIFSVLLYFTWNWNRTPCQHSPKRLMEKQALHKFKEKNRHNCVLTTEIFFSVDYVLRNMGPITTVGQKLSRSLCTQRQWTSGAVGWGTVPQDGRFRVRFPVQSLEIFKLPTPCVRIQ